MESLFTKEEFSGDRVHVDTFKKALKHIKAGHHREYDILCKELSYYHNLAAENQKQKEDLVNF